MFWVPWPSEIGAHKLLTCPTQHKFDSHMSIISDLGTESLCWEIFKNKMRYAFSICYVGKLRHQNRCILGTRNIESNGLM
jgi:hypothetical protein